MRILFKEDRFENGTSRHLRSGLSQRQNTASLHHPVNLQTRPSLDDHHERPHQDLENELSQKQPTKKRKKSEPNVDTIRMSDIRFEERLGVLLKSYSRVN